MNCDDVRPLLPLAVYGDLFSTDESQVNDHLATCPACRSEAESLRRLRATLDTVPVPEVSVPVGEVLRAEAADQLRRATRWKRRALAATALAAGLIAVLVVRPDVRIDDGALVVRWREPSAPVPPTVVYVEQPVRDNERVELMVKLVRAMSEDAEGRDKNRQKDIVALRARLDRLSVQEEVRWQEIQRDMGVLYRAQFSRREGGE